VEDADEVIKEKQTKVVEEARIKDQVEGQHQAQPQSTAIFMDFATITDSSVIKCLLTE
jgi:hypothetical protein